MGRGRDSFSILGMSYTTLLSALFACVLSVLTATIPTIIAPAPYTRNLLFFDGVCNLCDGFINFVAAGDSRGRVHFGALQRHKATLALLGAARYAEGGEEALSTVVLVQGKKVHVRSSAALRTLAAMDAPWKYLSVFIVIPAPIRDLVYRVVAEHRYTVFGRVENCRLPTEAFKARFIDPLPGDDENGGGGDAWDSGAGGDQGELDGIADPTVRAARRAAQKGRNERAADDLEQQGEGGEGGEDVLDML